MNEPRTETCEYSTCDADIIVTWWQFSCHEALMGGCQRGHIQVIQTGTWRGPTLCAYCSDEEAVADESYLDPYCSGQHRQQDRGMHLVRTLYWLLDDRQPPEIEDKELSEAQAEERVKELSRRLDTPPTDRNPVLVEHLVGEMLKGWVHHGSRTEK